MALLVVLAIVGAVVGTVSHIYHSGFNPSSGSWWAGLGIAAGAGALGGLTGGAVGMGMAAGLGASAGTLGGAMAIGAVSGMAGAGAQYGSAWLGLTVAQTAGLNVSSAGYSFAGLAQTLVIGAALGGAVGGGVWGGQQLYQALNDGIGNAAAAGRAAGEAGHRAAAAAGDAADDLATQSTAALDMPPPPPTPAPKSTLRVSKPNNVVAPGPKANAPPVEEPQPLYDDTQTGEFEQSNVTQRQPGWDKAQREGMARTRAPSSVDRAIRSTEARLAEHEAKLAAYKKDPFAFDNQGNLARNASRPEIQQQIINGRIRHLETEIWNFRSRLDGLRSGKITP